MAWWIWSILGFALLSLELFIPSGFFLLFFGCGALVMGGLVFLGFSAQLGVELAIFVVLSAGFLLLFRKRLLGNLGARAETSADLAGEIVTLEFDLEPGAVGRGECRGTSWQLKNAGSVKLPAGSRARVIKRDGLDLHVSSENA